MKRRNTQDTLLAQYRSHLQEACGVTPHTRDLFVWHISKFLKARFGRRRVDLRSVCPKDVIGYIVRMAKQYQPNTRKSAVTSLRSFFRWLTMEGRCDPILAHAAPTIPGCRCSDLPRGLSEPELRQLLHRGFDRTTRFGLRGYAAALCMARLGLNTGGRVSEVARLWVSDVSVSGAPHVRFHGKGRKERVIPLWRSTARLLQTWLGEVGSDPLLPIFPNRNGRPLTRSGIEDRLAVAVQKASEKCPSLEARNVSPHTLRHTTAMHLLQSGVDLATIALWLGHESPSTTHGYIEADLRMKETALGKLKEPPATRRTRYQATDSVLAFLERLPLCEVRIADLPEMTGSP